MTKETLKSLVLALVLGLMLVFWIDSTVTYVSKVETFYDQVTEELEVVKTELNSSREEIEVLKNQIKELSDQLPK